MDEGLIHNLDYCRRMNRRLSIAHWVQRNRGLEPCFGGFMPYAGITDAEIVEASFQLGVCPEQSLRTFGRLQ